MANTYDIHYAEVEKGETLAVDSLWAGDTPSPVTIDVLMTNAAAIGQFVPLQRDATTQAYEPWEAGNEIVAVTAYPIAIGTNVRNAVYTAGCFNLDAIAWPDGTTEAEVEADARGMCVFRKLLWSDKRTGTEPAPGTPAGPA